MITISLSLIILFMTFCHGWIVTKLQEQNLEEEKRGSLMLRQWWWGCAVLLSHLSFA